MTASGIRITQRCTDEGIMSKWDKDLHSYWLRPPGMSQELFVQTI